MSQYILNTTADCATFSQFEETLQLLIDDEMLGGDLKFIADNIRLGRQSIANRDFEEALEKYEVALIRIKDVKFQDYNDLFDAMLVDGYSNICPSQLAANYQTACDRLTDFARQVQVDSTYLAHTEEIQLWEFEAAEGDFVSIAMSLFDDESVNPLDPYVSLLDSNGFVIAAEDDYLPGHYSKITVYRVPEDGLYYVRAAGYEGESSGPYELIVSLYNDPVRIEPGVAQSAATGEIELYSFAGQAGDFISITMTAVESSLRPRLLLLNPQGDRLTDASSEGSATATLSDFAIDESGTYFLLASGLVESEGSYELLLTRSTPPTLAFGQTESADFAEVQTWQFTGDAEQIISVAVTAVDESILPTFDLFDSENIYLTSSQLSADGRTATLSIFILPASGNYFLRISDAAGQASGGYSVVITEVDPQSIDAIVLDTSTPGRLESDPLWLLSLPEGAETAELIRVRMLAIGQPRFTPYLTPFDAFGNQVQAVVLTDEDASAAEVILLVAPNQRYYLRTASVSGELEGQYTIRAESIEIPTIEIGEPVAGSTVEQPIWSFTGNEGETIAIEMNETDGVLDTVLVLYDAGVMEITRNDDYDGTTYNSLIEITLPEDGRYFINTRGFGGEPGTYELTVRRLGP